MAILSDITLLVAPPPPPQRETVTLDMSHMRYAAISPTKTVWAVFGLVTHARDYLARQERTNLRIIDLTTGNDVTTHP